MAVAFAACVVLRRRGERYVSTGLLLVGCAAFIGVLRFGVNPELADLHRFVSALATHTGMPLIAVQFLATCYRWPGPDGRMTTMGASVVGFAAFGLAFPLPVYGTIVGAASMIAVAAGAVRTLPSDARRGGLALAGAIGVALAGLVVGTDGSIGPLLRVDVFHAVLAASLAAIAAGLPVRASDAR